MTLSLVAISDSTADPGRRRHRDLLVLAIATIVAAFSLRLCGPDRIAFWFAPAYPLPNVCMARAQLGINCPGCGLTRSFVCLFHGNWRASLAYHPVGWVLALVVVAQIPYRLACLAGARPFPRFWTDLVAWSIFALLIGSWLARFV